MGQATTGYGTRFEMSPDVEKALKVRGSENSIDSSDPTGGPRRGTKAKSDSSASCSRKKRQPMPGAFPRMPKKGSSTDSSTSVSSNTSPSVTLPLFVSKNVTIEPETLSEKIVLEKIVSGGIWRGNADRTSGSDQDPFRQREQQIIDDVTHARQELGRQILENTRHGLSDDEASDIMVNKLTELNKKRNIRRYDNFIQAHMTDLDDLASQLFSLARNDASTRNVSPHYGEPWETLIDFVK